MYDSQPTITYFFRLTAAIDLKSAEKGLLPKDYFYYYHYVHHFFPIRTVSLLSHLSARSINVLNDHLLQLILHFDFPLFTLFPYLFTTQRTKVLFATTPKIGIGLALLKKCKLLPCRLIVNIVGLYDQLTLLNSPNLNTFVKTLFNEVDQFVTGASFHEAKMLSQLLKIPLTKFQFIPHSGIDTKYFSPQATSDEDFILGIGIDPSRDWELYQKIALTFPREKFIWATRPNLISFPIPPNVMIQHFSTSELKEKISASKFVLILTKLNHHFSGQASAMRAMSCGKAVILTNTPGVEEFKYSHGKHCFLVKPGNETDLISYIKKLNANPHLVKKVGQNAVQCIDKHYSYRRIGKMYVKLFTKIIGTV